MSLVQADVGCRTASQATGLSLNTHNSGLFSRIPSSLFYRGCQHQEASCHQVFCVNSLERMTFLKLQLNLQQLREWKENKNPQTKKNQTKLQQTVSAELCCIHLSPQSTRARAGSPGQDGGGRDCPSNPSDLQPGSGGRPLASTTSLGN